MGNINFFNVTSEFDLSNNNGIKFGISLIPCLLFIYLNGAMLYTLWSKTYFTETPRYILFSYMLSTDSLQLIWSLLAYLVSTVKVNMSNGMCAIFLLVANMLTRISPLNLAVMALERYAAICFPLRHAEIATSKRAGVAIGTIWILASLNALSEFFLFLTKGPPFHLIQIYCLRRELYESNVYIDLNNAFTSIYMVSVAAIIVYTYIAIMMETKSVSADKDSIKKARNTVLLHFIQLSLCLTSFLVGVLNTLASQLNILTAINVKYVIFMLLVILPRCLSPLIYGLRDERLRPLFVFYFTFGVKNNRVITLTS